MDNSIDFNHINVLMVGAGGIGCELLKCLVLSGFINIEVIDLDIIDVSNLNRQFLFRPHHVGQPKAQIAAESALKFNKNANILPKHISIFDSSFDVEYFKKFKIVISALDNIEARSHVNRLCLASNVYLIDAASQGYIGQTRIIIKGMTQCYECLPLPKKKNYPTCTIRNTPSEHIHCIIWAKHLFNLLFGEIDIDSDVIMSEKSDSDNSQKMTNGNVNKISLRKLAEEVDYDSKQLLYEIFFVNINNLLLMEKLWKERIAPIPLNVDEFSIDDIVPTDSHLMWSLSENVALFHHTTPILKQKMLESNNVLTWDKDDDLAMNFVTCVSNIRAHVFGIKQKTEFEIKSLAGNIIPAIATTNAVVSGLVVLKMLEVCRKKTIKLPKDVPKHTIFAKKPMSYGRIIYSCTTCPPNEHCYVCKDKNEISLKINFDKVSLKYFQDVILINELLLKEPDVIIKSTGSILISSDSADYNEDHMNKVLSSFDVKDGCVLICDDFSQDYILNLNLKEFKETELISLENSESDQVMYEIIQKTIVDVPTQRTDIEGQAYESDSDDLVIQTSKYDSEFEIETVEEIGGKRPKPIITDINIKLQKID